MAYQVFPFNIVSERLLPLSPAGHIMLAIYFLEQILKAKTPDPKTQLKGVPEGKVSFQLLSLTT